MHFASITLGWVQASTLDVASENALCNLAVVFLCLVWRQAEHQSLLGDLPLACLFEEV